MTTQSGREPENWAEILRSSEEERANLIRRLYESTLPLDETARKAKISTLIDREYALPDEQLHKITKAHLHALLDMSTQNAKTVAKAYDEVMQTKPGSIAMRRVGAVQTVTLGMTEEEVDRLYEIIPTVIRQIPRLAHVGDRVHSEPAERVSAGAEHTKEKRGWGFWKKG